MVADPIKAAVLLLLSERRPICTDIYMFIKIWDIAFRGWILSKQ